MANDKRKKNTTQSRKMTEGKRDIIRSLLSEYDIKSAQNI